MSWGPFPRLKMEVVCKESLIEDEVTSTNILRTGREFGIIGIDWS
jgi:hypothetical protein